MFHMDMFWSSISIEIVVGISNIAIKSSKFFSVLFYAHIIFFFAKFHNAIEMCFPHIFAQQNFILLFSLLFFKMFFCTCFSHLFFRFISSVAIVLETQKTSSCKGLIKSFHLFFYFVLQKQQYRKSINTYKYPLTLKARHFLCSSWKQSENVIKQHKEQRRRWQRERVRERKFQKTTTTMNCC